jgi:hypothetical protein
MRASTMFDMLLQRLKEAEVEAHTYRERCGDLYKEKHIMQVKLDELTSRNKRQGEYIAQLAQREPLPNEPVIEDVPF